MPKPIPCRPLPMILRIPRAAGWLLLLVLAVVALFATALWHSGGSQ